MQLTILPIPDVPNPSGVTFTKRAVANAISHYVAKYVTKGHALVISSIPTINDLSTDIAKSVGTIKSIWFDAESKSYQAIIKLTKNEDMYRDMKDSLVLATNKLGITTGNNQCDDENLKIISMSIILDPRK